MIIKMQNFNHHNESLKIVVWTLFKSINNLRDETKFMLPLISPEYWIKQIILILAFKIFGIAFWIDTLSSWYFHS